MIGINQGLTLVSENSTTPLWFEGAGPRIISKVHQTELHSIDNVKVAKDNKLAYIGERLSHKNGGFSESEGKWFLPFKGADPSVVRRTQVNEL